MGRAAIRSTSKLSIEPSPPGSIVLCNPWNPVGRALTESEIAAVVEVARTHRARVISDEIHGALVYGGGHIPAARFGPDMVITITSASKAWNTPGLKSAQVVLTNDDDREKWAGYFTPEKVGVGTLGLIATAAAYADGVGWLDEVMASLESNRDRLSEFIRERLPRVGYVPPEATYMAWLDLSGYGWENPAAHLLEEAGVGLTGGEPFGIGGEGHVRLNFATDEETLGEILERLAKTL